MARSLITDSVAHHVWATGALLDFCEGLTDEQLSTPAAGVYGSIIATLRHLIVGGDSFYVSVLDSDWEQVREWQLDIAGLRQVADRLGEAWLRLLATDPDPDRIIKEVDPADGYERDASVGMRIAQALHHGNEHRSQVCTALTALGLGAPDLSVWRFGDVTGRITDTAPGAR